GLMGWTEQASEALARAAEGSAALAPIVAFLGGALTALNPCVLAMIPLMIGVTAGLAGRTAEAAPHQRVWPRTLGFSLVFVAGFALELAILFSIAGPLAGLLGATWWKYVLAGICALPRFRDNAAVCAPVAALAGGAFLLGPGAAAFGFGFSNFMMAIGLAAAISLAVIPMDRIISPIPIVAIGGAIVGVANGWVLVLALALPATAVLLFPMRRERWSGSVRATLVCDAAAAVAGFGLLKAGMILVLNDPGVDIVRVGGIEEPSIGTILALVLGAAGVCVITMLLGPLPGRRALRDSDRRFGWLAIVPLTAIVVGIAIAYTQLRFVNELSYYFYKYVTATELVCLVIVVVGIGLLMTRRWAVTGRKATALAAGASVVLVLAATQAFGYSGPDLSSKGVKQTSQGFALRRQIDDAVANPSQVAQNILAASKLQARFPNDRVVYLATDPDGFDPRLAQLWNMALNGDWTNATFPLVDHLYPVMDGKTYSMVERAKWLLSSSPYVIVAVQPDQLDQVRAGLNDHWLASRVITFPDSGSS
ncbi:MAG: cytochrome c biogenesis protein CcdA, partial [Actinomycetes bacterium]